MRDERSRTLATVTSAVCSLTLLWCGAARAQTPGAKTFRGYAEVQYQKLDGEERSSDREWWVRSLQLSYSRRLASTLDVSAQAQVTDLSYIGRADRSRVPFATLRLAHTSFGAFGSYRPSTATDLLGATVRQQQTLLAGYWARAGWPRLDVSWDRRHQNAGSTVRETSSINRTAMASHSLGRLALRAAYTDQTQQPLNADTHRIFQRTLSGGSTLRIGAPRASMLLTYDYTDAFREETSVRSNLARTHAASATGGLRLAPRTDVNLTYNYRHSDLGGFGPARFADQDGALLLNHAPTRSVRLSSGGGVRTVRTVGHQDLEEYALVSASADGKLRPSWTGGAGVTRSLNWITGARARVIDGYRANTRMRLWKGMDVTADALVSVSGRGPTASPADSALSRGRVVTQGGVGFVAVPLRPISIGYSIRQYRAGESLGQAAVSARSDAYDIQWRPRASLQLSGNFASSQALGVGEPRLRTTRANAQWNPSTLFQLTVAYSRSTQARREAGAVELPGREILGVRLLSGIGRDLRASVGLNVVDPGRTASARQMDATVTRRFGG
jgi:hypothetical protein